MIKSPPSISPLDPELLSLAAAAELIKPQGKPISSVTMWRWATQGKRGVILPAVPVGRGLCTTREAIEWFFSALQAKQANKGHSSIEHAAGAA